MSTLLTLAAPAADLAAALPAIVDPGASQPPGTEGFLQIMGWAKWLALAVCILGIIAAGAMMAVNSRRGEGGEHAGRIGGALAGVVLIAGAFSLVGFLS